jgi:putative copper resistance protein D
VLALSAVRAIHFAVSIQAIGALLFISILGRLPAVAGNAAEHSSRRWLMIVATLSAAAIVPSGFAWLVLQAADMTGHTVTEAWDNGAVGLLLFKTHAGVVWWVRSAIAAALLIDLCAMASLRRVPSEGPVVVGLALAIANLVSCAWLSHAGSDAGPYASLHLAAHALHMLGVSLWLGGLIPLAMLVSRASHSSHGGAPTAARAISVSFGNIALLAVGTIIISGIATTALEVRDVSDLTTGTYAGLLAVKLGLFCLMLVLAAVNRLQLVPRLAASNPGPAAIRLWWSILAELALGLVILLVVGAMGITPLGTDE